MAHAKNNPYSVQNDDALDIQISFDGYLTMIDGKVAKVLTGSPSYQRCPLCHYKQSDFKREDIQFDTIDDNIKFGLRLESSQIEIL